MTLLILNHYVSKGIFGENCQRGDFGSGRLSQKGKLTWPLFPQSLMDTTSYMKKFLNFTERY